MRIILIFILLISTVNAQVVYRQTASIDSIQKVLINQSDKKEQISSLLFLCDMYWQENAYDSMIKYAEQALELAKEIKDKSLQSRPLMVLAEAYLFNNDRSSKSLTYAGEALKIAEELNRKPEIADCYGFIGIIYYRNEIYSESLKYGLLELKIRNEIGEQGAIGRAHQGIGASYNALGNFDQSLNHLIQALNICKSNRDTLSIGIICYSIGDIYLTLGKYKESLEMDSAALKILMTAGNEDALASAYEIMGKYYEKQGDLSAKSNLSEQATMNYDEAIKNYLVAHKVWSEQDRKGFIAEQDILIGNVHTRLKNFEIAKKYLDEGLAFAYMNGDREMLSMAYLAKSRLDSSLGNYKDAYTNYQLYRTYQDSLNSSDDARKAEGYRMQMEYEKNEAMANAIHEEKDRTARRTRNLQYIAIAAAVAIALFLFRAYKQKHKSNKDLEKAYTDLKATQQQLIQSEKMASLGELTAGIAHEIQNPLNFVNNFSEVNSELVDELVQEAGKGNLDEVKKIAVDIRENEQKITHHGKRADAIVKGMLQHSRSSSGQKELTDINELVDEYLRLAFHGLRAKDKSFNARFDTKLDPAVGKISVMTQDIGRVILNLINNAFYAANEKKLKSTAPFEPAVSIQTINKDGRIEIRVIDNGNGIPAQVLDKIFQPFFTTKPTGQGTGLGLSLSYDIIKAHGGELKVETKEGEGTTFIVHLPINRI